MPKTHRPSRLLLALLALLLAAGPACADILWSDTGFFVDMPEGFYLANGDGKTRFAFLSPDDGMEFDILSYDPAATPRPRPSPPTRSKKIGSTGEMESFDYQGSDCIFAELVFTTWAAPRRRATRSSSGNVALPPRRQARQRPHLRWRPRLRLRRYAGHAGRGAERSIALLAYTDAANLEGYADFILSCLDCFSIDRAALRAPGPVSQYLLPWPAAHDATKTVAFGEERIELPWSEDEAEQEQGTAGREFRVLQAYGDDPTSGRRPGPGPTA